MRTLVELKYEGKEKGPVEPKCRAAIWQLLVTEDVMLSLSSAPVLKECTG